MAEVYEKGQVVIPKHMREAFKMYPGTRVAFERTEKGVLVMPAFNVLEEMDKLREEGATLSDKETARFIAKMEKKRMKEMLDVPGLKRSH